MSLNAAQKLCFLGYQIWYSQILADPYLNQGGGRCQPNNIGTLGFSDLPTALNHKMKLLQQYGNHMENSTTVQCTQLIQKYFGLISGNYFYNVQCAPSMTS